MASKNSIRHIHEESFIVTSTDGQNQTVHVVLVPEVNRYSHPGGLVYIHVIDSDESTKISLSGNDAIEFFEEAIKMIKENNATD